MGRVTVDAIDGVTVDSADFGNELRTMHTLFTGLRTLAGFVKSREVQWATAVKGKVTFTSFGLDFDGTKDWLDPIACFFHWFGVSVCNYARLTGFIRGISRGELSRQDLRETAKFKAISGVVTAYVTGIAELKEVLVWRNKVAGHFAITDPWKNDNIATLDMSVVFPVSFTNGVYLVHDMQMTRRDSTGTHTSAIPSWSLTQVFEGLIPRYWPQLVASTVTNGPEATVNECDVPPQPTASPE
jgi:hypothetical protein